MYHAKQQDILKLDFLIVGGGLSGLATAHALASSGHHVRVFEASSYNTNSVASGFRVTSNGCKVLEQWGVWDEFTKLGCKVPSCEFVDLVTGVREGYLGWPDEVLKELGGEFYTISYNDLRDLLHRLALKSGVEIITNATVATVQPPISDEPEETPSSQSELDPTKPTVTLTTGEVYQGDLVVGADGQRGMVRDVIEEIPRAPPGGKVIYNGILPVETLQSNELLRDILEIQIPIWMGSGYYGIAFPIRDFKFWLFQFWQIEDLDDNEPQGWGTTVPTSCLKYGDNIDPRLKIVIEHIPFFERVKTDILPHAESWLDESETIFITGEAAHPMPTCAFTAAAIMLEEASFLGALFSHITKRSQISSFLYAFEDVRQPRARRLHELEDDNHTILQLPPGPARDARNHTWAEEKKANDNSSEAEDMELRRQWQGFFENWGYDGRDAAESWWHEWGVLAQRALQSQSDAAAQDNSNPWGQANGIGLQFGQVDVVVSED
ncbi:FAD/NAD-P-binding domain-containing protein [Stereum hirsutum FP-91666 SS1]|uniref:FAD/NAD-P-binding domain-containing protein n=1 Tax=Stereum hirsutum (strain FP-91666) TaxID=721885 RepID=UPI000440B682|nr:FAD/NAD-P-binding domain-containing protein [Stereum hirsutum FP-91666 SS1]EIM88749.1 FAD/NAD-P-binding domain-containing protein [Stereum hirsutum FP-91666 SS1]